MIAESAVLAPRLDPFPGLRPFTDQEAHLFFGRDGQSNEIVRLLETAGFATVVGTSGCGKSSLVRAGLLPTLWAGYASRAGSRWRVADLKPGSHPLANLAGALHQAGIAESVDAAALRSSSLALVSAVRRAREAGRLEPEENLLLLVDQFEELFPEESHERSAENTVADRDERAQFVALLLEAVRRREQRIFVVLTLRAEFLGECTRFRDLPETINCSQYLVPRMTRQQRHAAITGPVRVAGAEIAPRLVQRLLNELGDDPDALPVLQHTLLRTWNRWVENGPSSRPIDWADYESIGTLRDALDHHADEVLAEAGLRLGQGGETLVRRIFQRLRWRDDRGRERRSPAAIRELCAVAEADLEQVRTVVDCFRDDAAGRTFLTPFKSQVTEVSPETEIDITHESLLRRWTSLRDDWVQEEEESKRIYTDLAQRTEETRGGEDLLRGSLLERTFEWWQSRQPNAAWATRYRSNFAAARSYLFASWERYRRERILRRVAALLAVIGMCGLAAALNSFLTVRAAHRTAVVHLLAAKAALAVAGESTGIEMGLLLAVESLRRFPTPEAQAAANRALSLLPLRLASQPTPHARQVGFSAHGSLLTLLDEVGGLHFRSTAGQVRDVAGEPLPPLASFALARDATVLAAAGQGGTVFVVDATKRRKMAQFDCTPSPPIAISGNGRVVAAVCGRELRIWRAEAPRTETRLLPVKRREGAAEEKENWTQAALDYPGDIVVLGRQERGADAAPSSLLVMSLTDPVPERRLSWDKRLQAMMILTTSQGDSLLLGGDDGSVGLVPGGYQYELLWADTVQTIFTHPAQLTALSANEDGTRLIAGYRDGIAKVWDLKQNREAARMEVGEPVLSLALSDTAGRAVAVGWSAELQAWNLASLEDSRVYPRKIVAAQFYTAAPLLVQQETWGFRMLDLRKRKELGLWDPEVSTGGFYPTAVTPDGTAVVVREKAAEPFFRLNLRKLTKGSPASPRRGTEIGSPLWPRPVAIGGTLGFPLFSADGQHLAGFVRAYKRSPGAGEPPPQGRVGIFVWRTADGAEEAFRPVEEPESLRPPVFGFTPDSRRLLLTSRGGQLKEWTLADHREAAFKMAQEKGVTALAFSPDGSLLAFAAPSPETAAKSARILLHSYPEGRSLVSFGQTGEIRQLVFSPDSHYLLSASSDRTIVLWNLKTLQEEVRFSSPSPIRALAFTQDGKVVVVDRDRLLFRPWQTGPLLLEACGRVKRNLTPEEWRRDVPGEGYVKICSALP